jgi:methyl-accepting chemotaxis protein
MYRARLAQADFMITADPQLIQKTMENVEAALDSLSKTKPLMANNTSISQVDIIQDAINRFKEKFVNLTIEKENYDSAKASSVRQRVYTTVSISVIAGLILSFILSLWLARGIIKPVNLTNTMLKDISEGEGDLTKRIVIMTNDEVGELGQNFNHFVQRNITRHPPQLDCF